MPANKNAIIRHRIIDRCISDDKGNYMYIRLTSFKMGRFIDQLNVYAYA